MASSVPAPPRSVGGGAPAAPRIDPYAIVLAHLQASFEADVWVRGETGIDDVLGFKRPRPDTWAGQVRGGPDGPLDVQAQAVQTPSGLRWYTRCTCAAESQCQHGLAMLLAARHGDRRPDARPPDHVSDTVLDWVHRERMGHATVAATGAAAEPVSVQPPLFSPAEALFYGVHWHRDGFMNLRLYKSRLDAQGQPVGTAVAWSASARTLADMPRFLTPQDRDVLLLLRSLAHRGEEPWMHQTTLPRRAAARLLPALLRTGRVGADGELADDRDPVRRLCLLRPGAARPAALAWMADTSGRQRARLAVQALGCISIPSDPPWYLDPTTGEAGVLQVDGLAPDTLAGLWSLPPLSAVEAAMVGATLGAVAPTVARPPAAPLRRIEPPLVPVLRLSTDQVLPLPPVTRDAWRGYSPQAGNVLPMSQAHLSWRYGHLELDAASQAAGRDYFPDDNGQWVELRRDYAAEQAAQDCLHDQGFLSAPPVATFLTSTWAPVGSFILHDEAAWPAFMAQTVPALEDEGWQVQWDRHFAHGRLQVQGFFSRLTAPPSGVDEPGAAWALELGVEVRGQRLALPPMLADLLKREPRWFDAAQVDALADTEPVQLFSPDGLCIEIEAGRLKPIVRTLVDLFDTPASGASLSLSSWDALGLADLQSDPHWAFKSDAALDALAATLRASQGVQPVEPPSGLRIELRPYQRTGLAWLQYLRKHGLAGILADDMGLGKTAQTLAHVLMEKQAGRLTDPALVVLPTSLVFNWQAEARRIAPDLRVLVLHGKERTQRFEAIPQHDLVLTTYPLVWRDIETLRAYPFHLLVLDEAQAVKNALGRGAEAVRLLQARHRLCLTGTPLENHLGELWAQFDFLLPGLLGNAREFTRRWRTPIEKQGQTLRAQALAARIRPFLLRRRKEDVAQELPAKTEVVRRVALEGAQRDLYETVRATMDDQVRRAIAAQGLARSHIMLLDALLKLRQVCCDPRLLKQHTLPPGVESAKLDALAEMLLELVDEGRRVLVFSQFTEMLALIAQRLDADAIAHVSLTGRTRDRQAVVETFQAGGVPVFLISLKAGGVGLNLTAADTVIHFDPWWNPAAEAQATDRAHRIGQDKPVFVYKLVAAGSIEERILLMQQRKADLAEAVLGQDGEHSAKFSPADIDALLAPLE